MGFRLADLTGHYNAAEILGAGWSKDRYWDRYWDWSGNGKGVRQVNSSWSQEELLKHYPQMVFELKQHGDLNALRRLKSFKSVISD